VHDAALLAFAVSAKAAAEALKEAYYAAQLATDLRYQQRFEAQSDALAAAFLSQQTAMKTAFDVAEKAVNAALAAADRAVSKAELAADKRFEALNELRQMLNDMVATLITRVEAVQRFDGMTEKIDTSGRRVDALEARFNTLAGEMAGGERRGTAVKVDARANVGMIVGAVGGVVGLIALAIALARYFGGR
jgi:hypothetical protein